MFRAASERMMQAGKNQRCKMWDDKQRYKEANKKVEPQRKKPKFSQDFVPHNASHNPQNAG